MEKIRCVLPVDGEDGQIGAVFINDVQVGTVHCRKGYVTGVIELPGLGKLMGKMRAIDRRMISFMEGDLVGVDTLNIRHVWMTQQEMYEDAAYQLLNIIRVWERDEMLRMKK